MFKSLSLAALAVLAGCGSPGIETYQNAKPMLDIRDYFNGKLVAYGTIADRSGEITDRVVVDLNGTWDGNEGTLDEQFHYADGTEEHRTWHLTVDDSGTVTGTREDVIGAAHGRQLGNAMFLEYTLKRPHDGDTIELSADDRLYLVSGPYLVNEIKLSKYGITVATINLGFHKLSE